MKEFILRGNVVDMAVGVVIGLAFGTIVSSLVKDVIMPPIGLLLGGVDFTNFFILLKAGTPAGPYVSLEEAQAAGAISINYGLFLNAMIGFLIIALVMFYFIRMVNRLKREKEAPPAEPTTKACPFCLSTIAIKATRCAQCTSELETAIAA
ncbi:MAG TPA: large conductance mechanosensitive channel protein MscL [Anaerolineae bacterium]